MALIFLITSYCYFFVPQKKTRVILFLGVVPIAILCNAGRILATGVVGQYNRELAHGILHAAFGYVSLATGAILCILLHTFITKMGMERSRHA
jgi:exosortase/archaeosortase family protein